MRIINNKDFPAPAAEKFFEINAVELAIELYGQASLLADAVGNKSALAAVLGYIRAIADAAENMANGARVLRAVDRQGRVFYAVADQGGR